MDIARGATLRNLVTFKTIRFFPGVCLLVNAMTGPAIPFTAYNFQSAGWVMTIVLFLFFGLVSALCCLFMVEAMQAIPGNRHFQGTVEFATLINFYFSKNVHYIGQICLYGAIQSNAIQSIVLSSQFIDQFVLEVIGKTCGFGMNGSWICVDQLTESPSPFGYNWMLFTVGFIAVLLCVIPLGFWNLDDNISVQVFAFSASFVIFLQWIIASFLYVAKEEKSFHLPAFGANPNSFENVPGTIMLSLAFTFVVPSWVNLKKKTVNTQAVIWTATGTSILMYFLIGIIPGASFVIPDSAGGNIVPVLTMLGPPLILSKITAQLLFVLIIILPSIPVSFIVSRDNLIQNDIFNKPIATLLTFVVPWFVAIPFLTGTSLDSFISWSSILFVSTANFIIPLIIYLECTEFRKSYNTDRSVLTEKQRKLLKLIHASSQTIRNWVDRAKVNGIHVPYTHLPLTPSSSYIQTPMLPPPEIDIQPPSEIGSFNQQYLSPVLNDDKGSRKPSSVRFQTIESNTASNAPSFISNDIPRCCTPTRESPSINDSYDPATDELYRSMMFTLRRGTTTATREIQEKILEEPETEAEPLPAYLMEDVPDPDKEEQEYKLMCKVVLKKENDEERIEPVLTTVPSEGEINQSDYVIPIQASCENLIQDNRVEPRSPRSLRNRTSSRSSSPSKRSGNLELYRSQTLPSHPEYVGVAFQSIPVKVTQFISKETIAKILLGVVVVVDLLNFVILVIPS